MSSTKRTDLNSNPYSYFDNHPGLPVGFTNFCYDPSALQTGSGDICKELDSTKACPSKAPRGYKDHNPIPIRKNTAVGGIQPPPFRRVFYPANSFGQPKELPKKTKKEPQSVRDYSVKKRNVEYKAISYGEELLAKASEAHPLNSQHGVEGVTPNELMAGVSNLKERLNQLVASTINDDQTFIPNIKIVIKLPEQNA